VAAMLGAASPFAFLVCALAMAVFVTAFAIAGSRVSLTGGLYAYVEVAFGPFIGFLAGVLFFLTATRSVSGVVSLFTNSFIVLVPALESGPGRFLITLLLFAVLAWINVRGARGGTRAVELVTIVKLLPLLFFVGMGILFMHRSDAIALAWPSGQSLGQGVLLLIFAFAGIEVALVPSGEVINPARTVPRAIYLALAITTLLYVLIQLVAQGVLGTGWKIRSAPWQSGQSFSRTAGSLLLVAATSPSVCDERCPQFARILFALGRDRFLPKILRTCTRGFALRTCDPDLLHAVSCSRSLPLSTAPIWQMSRPLALFALRAAIVLMRRDVRSD
jgi:amino acid transporter